MKRHKTPSRQEQIVLDGIKAALRENPLLTSNQLRDIISPMASDGYITVNLHNTGFTLTELRRQEVARLKARIAELEAGL